MYGRPIPYGDITIWELPITPDMVERGVERRKHLPKDSNNSIMHGERTLHGLVAEEMVAPFIADLTETTVVIAGTRDYDLIVHPGVKIDLKTKVSDHVPHHDWDVSVAAANIDQKCDLYAFARIYEDFSRGFFLGFKLKEKYFEQATQMARGEMDYDNMYRVRADCYNMKIYKLD